jgi:hypothetical protein
MALFRHSGHRIRGANRLLPQNAIFANTVALARWTARSMIKTVFNGFFIPKAVKTAQTTTILQTVSTFQRFNVH